MLSHWRSYGPEVPIKPRNLARGKLSIIIKRVAYMGLQNWYNEMKRKGFVGTKPTDDMHGLFLIFPTLISTSVCNFGIDFEKCLFCSASMVLIFSTTEADINDRYHVCLITLSSETLHQYIGRGLKWTFYSILSSHQFQFRYISPWNISVDA